MHGHEGGPEDWSYDHHELYVGLHAIQRQNERRVLEPRQQEMKLDMWRYFPGYLGVGSVEFSFCMEDEKCMKRCWCCSSYAWTKSWIGDAGSFVVG